jgi:hypothetical protein
MAGTQNQGRPKKSQDSQSGGRGRYQTGINHLYAESCEKINASTWAAADAMKAYPQMNVKTLRHKLNNGTFEQNLNETVKRGLGAADRVLAHLFALISKRGFPFSPNMVKSYLYRAALAVGWTPKNPDMRSFYRDFMERHKDILGATLARNGQLLSKVRALCMSPHSISQFKTNTVDPFLEANKEMTLEYVGAFDEWFLDVNALLQTGTVVVSTDWFASSGKGKNYVICPHERSPHITGVSGFTGKWRWPLLVIFPGDTEPDASWTSMLTPEERDYTFVATTAKGWITNKVKLDYLRNVFSHKDCPRPPQDEQGKFNFQGAIVCDGQFTNFQYECVKVMEENGYANLVLPGHHTSGLAQMDAQGGPIFCSKQAMTTHARAQMTGATTDTSRPVLVKLMVLGYIAGHSEAAIGRANAKTGWSERANPDRARGAAKSNVVYDPMKVIDKSKFKASAWKSTQHQEQDGDPGLDTPVPDRGRGKFVMGSELAAKRLAGSFLAQHMSPPLQRPAVKAKKRRKHQHPEGTLLTSEHLKEVEEAEAAAAEEKKRKKTERDMGRAQKKRQDQQEAERKHAARQAKLRADQERASSALADVDWDTTPADLTGVKTDDLKVALRVVSVSTTSLNAAEVKQLAQQNAVALRGINPPIPLLPPGDTEADPYVLPPPLSPLPGDGGGARSFIGPVRGPDLCGSASDSDSEPPSENGDDE